MAPASGSLLHRHRIDIQSPTPGFFDVSGYRRDISAIWPRLVRLPPCVILLRIEASFPEGRTMLRLVFLLLTVGLATPAPEEPLQEIGRASCRERVGQ